MKNDIHIERANTRARILLAPEWRVFEWSEADRAKAQARGMNTISTLHTHDTPPVNDGSAE
jgi:catechol 2,3-dioxygenase